VSPAFASRLSGFNFSASWSRAAPPVTSPLAASAMPRLTRITSESGLSRTASRRLADEQAAERAITTASDVYCRSSG